MVVDIGMPLSALVRKSEYGYLGIGVGDTVEIKCSDYGVEII